MDCQECGEFHVSLFVVIMPEGQDSRMVCGNCKKGRRRCAKCRLFYDDAKKSGVKSYTLSGNAWICWDCCLQQHEADTDNDYDYDKTDSEKDQSLARRLALAAQEDAWLRRTDFIVDKTVKLGRKDKEPDPDPVWQVCTVTFEDITDEDEAA